jgi:5-methylcytosine-specific restriction endonuclease McrA
MRLGANYDIDHIKPLSKGGTNHPKNLQLTCPSCNGSKKDKDPLLYARLTGRLL